MKEFYNKYKLSIVAGICVWSYSIYDFLSQVFIRANLLWGFDEGVFTILNYLCYMFSKNLLGASLMGIALSALTVLPHIGMMELSEDSEDRTKWENRVKKGLVFSWLPFILLFKLVKKGLKR